MIDFAQITPFIPLIIMGIAALVGIRSFITNAPPAVRMLAFLWIVLFVVEVIGLVTSYFSLDNYWFYNLWWFFWFMYLAYIYFQVLERESVRLSIQVFYVVFIVFFLINSLFIQGLFKVQSLTFVVGGVFIIYLAVAYFWALFISSENEKITHDPFFWLSFALIIYFGSTVPFYGMFNYIHENFFEFIEFYQGYISKGFSIFLNILVIIAFLCRRSYPK